MASLTTFRDTENDSRETQAQSVIDRIRKQMATLAARTDPGAEWLRALLQTHVDRINGRLAEWRDEVPRHDAAASELTEARAAYQAKHAQFLAEFNAKLEPLAQRVRDAEHAARNAHCALPAFEIPFIGPGNGDTDQIADLAAPNKDRNRRIDVEDLIYAQRHIGVGEMVRAVLAESEYLKPITFRESVADLFQDRQAEETRKLRAQAFELRFRCWAQANAEHVRKHVSRSET